ncbi:MAG: glycosyltransferase family 4 protein [Methanothermobacter sp.]|nr:glycosyltransferase family 4 protein [Methanothermobacter sp.]
MDKDRKWYLKIVQRILNESEINMELLEKFDIVHVHGPIGIRNTLKLYKCKKPIILTLHGWVTDEILTEIWTNPSIINFLYFFYALFNWVLHRLIFIPFIYKGRVTAVSRITMEKNGVKGVVIPNAFIPENVDKKVNECKNLSFDDFTLITYVSIGGSKVASIPKLSRIITEANKRTGKKIQLLVFGDTLKVDNPYIKMMGYQKDFLCYLKSANMMLLGYEMSELGYAVMEAGYLSVPIAKFKGEFEELKDGIHGIIAENEEEMIQKLVEAVENPSRLREWGENLREYILKTRSPSVIAEKWQTFLESSI